MFRMTFVVFLLGSTCLVIAQGRPVSVELARISAELEQLKTSVASMKGQTGPQGPPGPPGPIGPKGDRGEASVSKFDGFRSTKEGVEFRGDGGLYFVAAGRPSWLAGVHGPKGRASVVASAKDDRGSIVLFGDNLSSQVTMGAAAEAGYLQISDQKSRALLNLGPFGNAAGGYAGFRGASTPAASPPPAMIGATDIGGEVTLRHGTSGVVNVFLGANARGATARFNDEKGKTLVSIESSAGKGAVSVNGRSVGDHAEIFELGTRESVVPGTVMVAYDVGNLRPSQTPYDRRVVGVISGARGLSPATMIGGRHDGTNDLPVAIAGQVYVKVCLDGGRIDVGSMLVTSSRGGTAMNAAQPDRSLGAVLGKSLEKFGPESGQSVGWVRMLVMLR